MKTRLAKKIMARIFRFRNIESNYLPYSKPKQTKAVRTLLRHLSKECRMSYMETLPGHKVPLRWRKIERFHHSGFDSLKAE